MGHHLCFFFSKFGEGNDFSVVTSKAGIATDDIEIMVTVKRKNFIEISIFLIYGGWPIYGVLKAVVLIAGFVEPHDSFQNRALERKLYHSHNPNKL